MQTAADWEHRDNEEHDDARVIRLDGAFNLRDLGGFHGRTGASIRPGKVYRSDDPLHASEQDIGVLAGLGIRTVVDLRTPLERGERGTPTWDRLGVPSYACPLAEQVSPLREHGRYLDSDWTASRYLLMLTGPPEPQVAMWQTLASGSDAVTLVHCLSGRDRTGVVVAVLLKLLGVDDESIIADYAMSSIGMRRMARWYDEHRPGDLDKITGNRQAMVTTAPETMHLFLERFRDRFGSAEEYATEIGVTDSVERLRANLLDRGGE
jgi:protein-tyrosine phosphatase